MFPRFALSLHRPGRQQPNFDPGQIARIARASGASRRVGGNNGPEPLLYLLLDEQRILTRCPPPAVAESAAPKETCLKVGIPRFPNLLR
jgi:hypothetical protein